MNLLLLIIIFLKFKVVLLAYSDAQIVVSQEKKNGSFFREKVLFAMVLVNVHFCVQRSIFSFFCCEM